MVQSRYICCRREVSKNGQRALAVNRLHIEDIQSELKMSILFEKYYVYNNSGEGCSLRGKRLYQRPHIFTLDRVVGI